MKVFVTYYWVFKRMVQMDYQKLIDELKRYRTSNGSTLGRHWGLCELAADAISQLLNEIRRCQKQIDLWANLANERSNGYRAMRERAVKAEKERDLVIALCYPLKNYVSNPSEQNDNGEVKIHHGHVLPTNPDDALKEMFSDLGFVSRSELLEGEEEPMVWNDTLEEIAERNEWRRWVKKINGVIENE